MGARLDKWKVLDAIRKHHGSVLLTARELDVDRGEILHVLKRSKCAGDPAALAEYHLCDKLGGRTRLLYRFAGLPWRRWRGADLAEARAVLGRVEGEVRARAAASTPDLRYPSGRRLAAALLAVETGLAPQKALRRVERGSR